MIETPEDGFLSSDSPVQTHNNFFLSLRNCTGGLIFSYSELLFVVRCMFVMWQMVEGVVWSSRVWRGRRVRERRGHPPRRNGGQGHVQRGECGEQARGAVDIMWRLQHIHRSCMATDTRVEEQLR